MGALMIRNKHVFITGGGSGIGRAIALLFADEGAKVTITGRRSKVLEEVANKSVNIAAFRMDVSNEKEVISIIQARMSSVRFPGKVMKNLSGKPMIQRVISQVKYSKLISA